MEIDLTIFDIPPEIIDIFLSYTSYYISKLVCKYWKEIVGNKKNGIIGINNEKLYKYFETDMKKLKLTRAKITTEALLEDNRVLMDYMYGSNFYMTRVDPTIITNYFRKKTYGNFGVISYYDIDECIPRLLETIIEHNPSLYFLKWLEEKYHEKIFLESAIRSRNIENIKYLRQFHMVNNAECFIKFIGNQDVTIFQVLDDEILTKYIYYFRETFILYDFIEGVIFLHKKCIELNI